MKENRSKVNNGKAAKWAAFLVTLILLTVLYWPSQAFAVGTLINAPGRVDMVYDDARGVLYVTAGGSVLRYRITTDSFLSPIVLGGQLKGIDLSPDGNTLLVADVSYSSTHLWVHEVNLINGQNKKVTFPRAFYEGGAFTTAFGADGKALITSRFLGSGWVPLRKYDPVTGQVSTLASVRQDTMLRASADGSAIGFAESNSSDGPFGRYRVSDGNLLRKSGYTNGTSWFNYEIAANRNASQYAIPTYGGTFITDGNMVKYDKVGSYAGGQPIGVVYHPTGDVVYFAWATTPKIYAYDTNALTKITEYDFQNTFDHPGNHAFSEGRLKISRDGLVLFATVGGGVRYLLLDPLPLKTTVSSSPAEADGDNGWFKTNPEITFTTNNTATTYFSWNTTESHTTFLDPFYPPSQGGHTLYYFSANISDETESVRNRSFKIDTADPIDPIITSPGHVIGVQSYKNSIDIGLSGATDSASGVDGFSMSWSKDTTEVPDASKDLEEHETETTSGILANGLWYFNLRTVDNAGNWTNTTHQGPFELNGAPIKTQLTSSADDERMAGFSPDGSRILYTVVDPETFESDIWVMNLDGSGKTNLTNTLFQEEGSPSFSPDGAKILYTVLDEDTWYADIWVMNSDGSTKTNLTITPFQDELSPTFNYDGTKILYEVLNEETWYDDIWVMNSDGSAKTNLTNTPNQDEAAPEFSHDGTKILYSVMDDDTWNEDIWVMNSDGSGKINLTNTPDEDEWSPTYNFNSTRILYSTLDNDTWDADIWVMNSDGSAKTNLTETPDQGEWTPRFGSGGNKIIFTVSDPDTDHGDIYRMNADGSGKENLTDSSGQDEYWPVLSPTEASFTFQVDSPGGDQNIWLFSNFDLEPPIDPIITSPSHTTDTASPDNTIEIAIAGATDAISGVDGFSVSWSRGAPELPNTIKDLEETDTSITSPRLGDGIWYFNLRTRDNIGNWTSTVHLGPFSVEAGAPNTTISTEPSEPNGSAGWFTVEPKINLTPDDLEAETFYSWDSTFSVSAYSDPFLMQAEGEHTIYFYSVDWLTNTETIRTENIKLDRTAPVDPDDLVSTPAAGTFTNDNTIDISFSGASDAVSGVDGYSVSWSRDVTETPNKTKNLEETETSTTSPPLDDGTWYFNLRTRDNAGNWTSTIHAGPYKIETVAPTGTIWIPKTGTGAFTRNNMPRLELAATDGGGTGVTSMRFKNEDGVWSKWLAFSPTVKWNLSSGNGEKRVWVQFKDAAGNISAAGSDTILFDTVKPSLVVLTVPRISSNVSKTNIFKIRWTTASDPSPGSGVNLYDLQHKFRGGKWISDGWYDRDFEGWSEGRIETFFFGTPGKTYYFRIKIVDNAGNVRFSRVKKTIAPFDNNSQISRIRGFTRSTKKKNSRFYLGTTSYSSRVGQSIAYRFTGRSVTLISTKARNRSNAKIYIDGKYRKTVNGYSAKAKHRREVFSASWRKRGRHTIKIVNMGTKGRRYYDVDGLAVGQ